MAGINTPDSLAADMLMAAGKALVMARVAVQASAKQIKDEAKANVLKSAPTHNAGAHKAITYETGYTKTGVAAIVGYDKSLPGGALGNLLEYGGGGDKSPAHRDIGRAADSEEPRFADAIFKLSGRLL